MSGDWIKMRGNLWDDPRVASIVDATDSSEAAVIGALYWLWATADQHTEDGIMPGLSMRQIDRKTGVSGFAAALQNIGWIADHPEGILIVRFDEHNGASAKKRCQTAKRGAKHKAGNAQVTQESETANAGSVSGALPRDRDREDKSSMGNARERMSEAGACSIALREAGFQVTSQNPNLLAYIAEGGSPDHLKQCAGLAGCAGKPAGYVIAAARRELASSASATPVGNARAGPAAGKSKTLSAIEKLQALKLPEANHDPSVDAQRTSGRPEHVALPAAR